MSFRKRLARLTQPVRRALSGYDAVTAQRLALRRRHASQDYFYLGQDLGIKRLNAGPMLYVDTLDEQVCAGIIAHGFWEIWVAAVVTSLIRPGGRIVEVGANVGYYTMLMADCVGPQGQVTALEANPRLVGLIEKSVRVNGFGERVRLVHRAAMEAPGIVDFVSFRTNSGGGHVPAVVGAHYDDALYGEAERFQVAAVRLDDLDCGRVDMIRIDAEGSEPFILRGAAGILAAHPDILICMEWSVVQMASRTSVPDFIDWLVGLGFQFWRIGYDSGLTEVSAQAMLSLDACDVIASRKPPRFRD